MHPVLYVARPHHIAADAAAAILASAEPAGKDVAASAALPRRPPSPPPHVPGRRHLGDAHTATPELLAQHGGEELEFLPSPPLPSPPSLSLIPRSLSLTPPMAGTCLICFALRMSQAYIICSMLTDSVYVLQFKKTVSPYFRDMFRDPPLHARSAKKVQGF